MTSVDLHDMHHLYDLHHLNHLHNLHDLYYFYDLQELYNLQNLQSMHDLYNLTSLWNKKQNDFPTSMVLTRDATVYFCISINSLFNLLDHEKIVKIRKVVLQLNQIKFSHKLEIIFNLVNSHPPSHVI